VSRHPGWALNDETYEGVALLKALSRRAMHSCPPYMEREDFIHAGWIAFAAARRTGKPFGYAKKAAWGAMMNELSQWIGVPPRAAGRLAFVPLSAITAEEIPFEPPLPSARVPDNVRALVPRLPKRQRECVGLYLLGHSLTEIAQRFGISPSNVQTHIYAGCDNIKLLLWRDSHGQP
jgi:DNA-directed RNA polymerase specialized sigma24 family protein